MRFFVVLLLTAMVAILAWAEEPRFQRPRPAVSKRSAEPDSEGHFNPNHFSKRAAPSPQHEASELFKREVMEPGNEREGRLWRRFWGPRWGWGLGWGYPYGFPYGYYGGYHPFWG